MHTFEMPRLRASNLVFAAALAGFSSAYAADVTLYGLVDYGFIYTHKDNGVQSDNTLQMESSKYTGSRVGIKGEEDLGNGVKAGFILENGFAADSGSMNVEGKLFDREAVLYLSGDAGMIKFGRMTRLTSSTGSTSIFGGRISAFSTGWGAEVPGYNGVFAGALTRFDNMVMYSTPEFAGTKLYAQYSFGTGVEEGEVEGTSSTDRYLSIGTTVKRGAFNLSAAVESFNWASWDRTADKALDVDDGLVLAVGGAYDLEVVKLFAAGFKFDHMPATVAFLGDKTKLSGFANENLEGHALNLGVTSPIAGGTLRFSAGWMAAEPSDEIATNRGAELDRYAFALGYEKPLSKRTTVYAGAGYTVDRYDGEANFSAKTTGVIFGMAHKF